MTSDAKPCRTCGAMKPPAEFYRSALATDGRRGSCKECVRVQTLNRYYSRPHDAIAASGARRHERVRRLKPGQRLTLSWVGSVRYVVERQADGQLKWLKETLDNGGKVIESVPGTSRAKRKTGP